MQHGAGVVSARVVASWPENTPIGLSAITWVPVRSPLATASRLSTSPRCRVQVTGTPAALALTPKPARIAAVGFTATVVVPGLEATTVTKLLESWRNDRRVWVGQLNA